MSLCTSVSSADVRDVVLSEKNRFDCLMQSKLSEAVPAGADETFHGSFLQLRRLRAGFALIWPSALFAPAIRASVAFARALQSSASRSTTV